MSIDESKMAVDSSFSFLNLRKQHTNLKLNLLFKIETQTNSLSKIAPHTPLTKRLYGPTPDTQTRLASYSLASYSLCFKQFKLIFINILMIALTHLRNG